MDEDDPRITDAIADASLVMYYLTGRQFAGTCTTTVRPPCLSGQCACGCTPRQVNLGLWPVTDLISVKYQGVEYAGAEIEGVFHVDEYHYLVRDDGLAFLSGNQWALTDGPHDNMSPDGFVFEVTFQHGIKIPPLLERATRELACQFVSICCEKECSLPERVTSVARVGVTFNVANVTDLLAAGRTGLYTVDLAIEVFNPSKLQSPSFAWHPGITHTNRRVNTTFVGS